MSENYFGKKSEQIQKEKLLRLPQILKVIPVCRSTWWEMVKDGRAPQPIKLGPRTTCWRESDIQRLAKEGVHHGQ